jgi:glucose-6-phosphate isomerase
MGNGPIYVDMTTGRLAGEDVTRTVRKIGDLAGVFGDEEAIAQMDLDMPVYEVEAHESGGEIEGGLYFGVSRIFSGKVGDEYFMTKGHFHAIRERGEYYWGIQGTGVLLLMDEARRAWTESVAPGSLHYIPGRVAHRLINTGPSTLAVGACWPSDAGHDYEAIKREGFPLRFVEKDGKPIAIGVNEK